jgi:hypothetical protein
MSVRPSPGGVYESSLPPQAESPIAHAVHTPAAAIKRFNGSFMFIS